MRRLKTAALSLWLILAVALGARGLYAWNEARHAPPRMLAAVSFAQESGNIAQALAQGRGFSDPYRQGTGPTAWLAPVYPLLLAGIFRAFGIFTPASFWAAALLNILCSVGACIPLFFAGKRVGGVTLAAGAAWLWALFPNGVLIPFEWIWDTSLAALLAATILWATLALDGSERTRDWVGYGLLWGLTLLTTPALGSLAPFLLAWLAWRRRRSGNLAWLRRPALAAAISALCLVPWTVRNYARFHRFVPLRSDFPFELWIGNNEVLNPQGRDVMARVTAYGQIREYVQLGETAFLQKKWQEAASFILAHKRLELWLTKRRLVAMWIGSPDPIIDFRDASSPFIRFLYMANALAALGALAGILALFWKRSPYAFPVVVFPVVFPCVYYVTHASLRYRNPVDPVVMLLGAAAIEAIFSRGADTRDIAARNSSRCVAG
jgi:4-amino-4-deoxy-L-arabinose transferase-like glycosyltransferase